MTFLVSDCPFYIFLKVVFLWNPELRVYNRLKDAQKYKHVPIGAVIIYTNFNEFEIVEKLHEILLQM